MKIINKPTTLLALAIAASFQAQAQLGDIRINGFANLSAGMTSEDTTVYGISEDIDFASNSLFALQISGDVNDKVTATAQIIARGSDDYDAEFEWAYLSYSPSDKSTITAGRFLVPVFRYSSSLNVAYSYHWIDAPQAVYDVPFNNINGIRYDYADYVGDFEYLFQASFGNYHEEVSGGEIETKNVYIASVEGVYNNFKGRLVYGRGTNTFSQPTFDEAIATIRASVPSLADELEMNEDTGEFLGIGLDYDNFNWFINSEYTVTKIKDSFSPKDIGYYVSAGLRMGKWTPHITYQARDGEHGVKFTNTISQLPEPLQGPIGAVNSNLQARFFEDFSITTLGVRYDAMPNIAIKAELSRYENNIDTPVITDPVADTNLLKFSLNYVF